jgi:MoxR-like ATPase
MLAGSPCGRGVGKGFGDPWKEAVVSDERAQWFSGRFAELVENIEQVIQGKDEVVRLALVCLCAEGHLLLEDVPGTGKTSLAKAMAVSLDATWKRIQFTPDLLPSDVTGVSIYSQVSGEFEFKPGAVFANIVVGDEINRASPKTQSALLEVMEEHRVTVDAVSHPVPRPFMVVATQNPIDMDGTYQLPEAQLDRFLMKVSVGYPDHEAEVDMLNARQSGSPLDRVTPAMTGNEARTMIAIANEVHVAPAVKSYIVSLCAATRAHPSLRLGASPRASLALMRATGAHAASQGRSYATPEDVKALAHPVLAHRLILTPEAELHGSDVGRVLQELLDSVPIPRTVGV